MNPNNEIPLERAVAVVVELEAADGSILFQTGSGYLVSRNLVLTAEHCTRDKTNQRSVRKIRVIAAYGAQGVDFAEVVAASPQGTGLDIAVLSLSRSFPTQEIAPVRFATVSRTHTGILDDCVAIGFPIFQSALDAQSRSHAEIHGTIYRTEMAAQGRLVLREPRLSGVSAPLSDDVRGERTQDSPWGGLSGAVVFCEGFAIGVIIEHYPQQGPSAVQLATFDQLLDAASAIAGGRDIAAVLGIRSIAELATVTPVGFKPIWELAEFCLAGRLPVVSDLDPYRLGTSVSEYGNSSTYGKADNYVRRTHNRVEQRLAAAVVAKGFVIISGASKTGKTRSAFEAAREHWGAARLFCPNDNVDWSMVANHPEVAQGADGLVVWLDDIDRFLSGPDVLRASSVRGLLGADRPTLLLATLRADRLAKLRGSEMELDRNTRDVLSLAEMIELQSTGLSESETEESSKLYPNGPHEWGLAERLANVPQLLSLYRESESSDQLLNLVVRIAVDWARVGFTRPLAHRDMIELVREIAWSEHPENDLSDSDIEAAISRARRSVMGGARSSLLMTKPLTFGIRGYWPFEYLVAADEGATARPDVASEFWRVALNRCNSPVEFVIFAAEAFRRGRLDVAIEANTSAAGSGQVDAMYNLGVLNHQLGAWGSAKDWYERAVDQGHPQAMFNLALMLRASPGGSDAAARTLFEGAARSGLPDAMYNLAIMLAVSGDTLEEQEAIRWYEEAARRGHANSAFNLAIHRRRAKGP